MKKKTITQKGASTKEMRVSKKFYADISLRVKEACLLAGKSETFTERVLGYVDEYIRTSTVPLIHDSVCLLIFNILRPEIDRAIERSTRARRRAANRREVPIVTTEKESLVNVSQKSSPIDESIAPMAETFETQEEPDLMLETFKKVYGRLPANRRERRQLERDRRRIMKGL